MKKQSVLSATIFCSLALAIFSCKKTTTTPTHATPPSTTTSSTPTPNAGDVDGALVSLKVDVTTVVGGYPVTITTDNGIATFFASTGNNSSFVAGGTVSVNNVALDKQSNNGYVKSATTGQTPADLGFDNNTSNWNVGGNGSVPAFTYNHSVAFPAFTGTLPASINRSGTLSIALGSNVSNADSVILFIATNDHKSVTRTFAGTAATATIASADLASLPAVSDNTALIEVIPYRITLNKEGSKNYAFIKERAIVSNINIQ